MLDAIVEQSQGDAEIQALVQNNILNDFLNIM